MARAKTTAKRPSRLRRRGTMHAYRLMLDDSQLDLLHEYLQQFDLALQSKILAEAFAWAGRPVVRAAKGYARAIRDSGLLEEALGCFVKVNRKTKVPYALLTANAKVRRSVTRRDGRTMIANPSKYLHLVELGTRHSAANPILGRALEARGDAAADRIFEGVNRATEKNIRQFEGKLRRTLVPRVRR
jgi:hypothetical protein